MNYSIQNNVSIYGGHVFINNERMPECPAKNTNNSTIINGHVFIGGYELKNGEWKKTLRALWHKIF